MSKGKRIVALDPGTPSLWTLLGSLELFLDQQCLPYAVLLNSSLLVDAVMNE